jgi:hypothetical protein
MRLIGDEAAARRHARAIGSDIALYNEEKLRRGEPLVAEIAEGRELFRARVEPQLLAVYDAEIEHMLGARIADPAPNVPPTDYRRVPPPPRLFAPERDREPSQSPWPARVLLITLVLFVFAAIASAFMRRW